MGLDTSHDAWHGPYSSFNEFRGKLASKIGVDIKSLEGYGGEQPFPKDDLSILLDHSDCDGDIKSEDCEKLANRLDELLKDMPKEPNVFWSLHEQTSTFIKGLRLAHSKNEPLDFH